MVSFEFPGVWGLGFRYLSNFPRLFMGLSLRAEGLLEDL